MRVTFAEMIESSEGQEEHLKHRPMTFTNFPYLILLSSFSLLARGLFLITWNRKKVIHRGDVIHSLRQHSDLLLPLVFEDVHVVLSNFALWPGSQGESRIDDLFIRNSPRTHWELSSKYHLETPSCVASSDKWVLSVQKDNKKHEWWSTSSTTISFCLLCFSFKIQ